MLQLFVMDFPKLVVVVQCDELIQPSVWVGIIERGLPSHQDEKGNSSRKQVIHDSIVVFLDQHLR